MRPNTCRFTGAVVCTMFFLGSSYAQRNVSPRAGPEIRSGTELRVQPTPRECRPAVLSAEFQHYLFSEARSAVVPACDMNVGPSPPVQRLIDQLTQSGTSMYAVESQPYGPSNIRLIQLFVVRDSEGPIRIPGKPELESWAVNVGDLKEAHKVHIEWIKLIALRYVNLWQDARNPTRMLANLISSNLSVFGMATPPTSDGMRAFANCTAFAIDLGAAAATIQGSFGLSAAFTMVALAASGKSCVDSLRPFFEAAEREQQHLDQERERIERADTGRGGPAETRPDNGRGPRNPERPSSPGRPSPPGRPDGKERPRHIT